MHTVVCMHVRSSIYQGWALIYGLQLLHRLYRATAGGIMLNVCTSGPQFIKGGLWDRVCNYCIGMHCHRATEGGIMLNVCTSGPQFIKGGLWDRVCNYYIGFGIGLLKVG